MISEALTITLAVHGVTPGNEPLGQNVELIIRPDGIHDPRGLGESGEAAQPLAPQEAADRLAGSFDRYALALLLGHVERLREALDTTAPPDLSPSRSSISP
jgi:hypothetical protein